MRKLYDVERSPAGRTLFGRSFTRDEKLTCSVASITNYSKRRKLRSNSLSFSLNQTQLNQIQMDRSYVEGFSLVNSCDWTLLCRSTLPFPFIPTVRVGSRFKDHKSGWKLALRIFSNPGKRQRDSQKTSPEVWTFLPVSAEDGSALGPPWPHEPSTSSPLTICSTDHFHNQGEAYLRGSGFCRVPPFLLSSETCFSSFPKNLGKTAFLSGLRTFEIIRQLESKSWVRINKVNAVSSSWRDWIQGRWSPRVDLPPPSLTNRTITDYELDIPPSLQIQQ